MTRPIDQPNRSFFWFIIATLILCIAPPSISMSEPQNADMEKVIHDYILAHPEVVVEALQLAKRKHDEQLTADTTSLIQARKRELVDDPDALIFGNPKGDVTLVEFFDYRCPYCRQMEAHLRDLVRADPQLRIVQKQFPILGPQSVLAARAALAAKKQGKDLELHEAFMNKRLSFDEASIMGVAESIGLDVARLKIDMASPEVAAELIKSAQIARELQLNGTPAFIVGSIFVPGATDLETLVGMVADARRKSE